MTDYPTNPPMTTQRSPLQKSLLPIEVAIGLTTVPFLVAIVGTRVLSSAVQDLGRWSEELFRGDRLPSLDPQSASSNPSQEG